MHLTLDSRRDITLGALYRVAWKGEAVVLSEAALSRIAACRQSFLDLIEHDHDVIVYGVTTAMGEFASVRLADERRERHARLKPFAAGTAFGGAVPERVVRGVVLARLANFLEGHAATSPRIALAVAGMLDGGAPLPEIAAWGHGGAGEIQALYPLFAALSTRFELEVRERGSLINGAPCAAALVGDAALAARRRYGVAVKTFALSIEAFGAPLEHYDEVLEALWGDPHEAAALNDLRGCLSLATEGRRGHQAPVSYRIAPKVLGQAHRALAGAEQAATISLSSVSDNPVYLPPDAAHPRGRAISTGGYHNAMAAPAMDALSAAWADLCQLCLRHGVKLLDGRISQMPDLLLVGREPGDSDGHGNVGYLTWALAGYIEKVRAIAQPSFIPAADTGGLGQDDVGAPAFLAHAKEAEAGLCLDACLAILALLSAQALFVTGRSPPPALRDFVDRIESLAPPVVEDRLLGPDLARLAQDFTDAAFACDRPLR